ncbi:hypothetical protein GCM10022234_10300 [Aeromicrobium panaciterrae]|uniref:diguanylate cyclase domain-containing protein n=1 Tax=Aeromicrobium panaciterrae TaxID=363861 RepID=UPI0031E11EB0
MRPDPDTPRDPLTGLVSRRGWDLIVAEAQHRIDDQGDRVAVAVIAIDGLEALTRAKGENAGKEVIRRSANALKAVAGSGDWLARSGGTFLAMAHNVGEDDLPEHFGIFVDAMAAHGVTGLLGFAAAAPSVTDAHLRAIDALAEQT